MHGLANIGVIPNVKPGVKTEDYDWDINEKKYGRLKEQKFIPKLPTKSVVVIDNAPYDNTKTNHARTSIRKKIEMIECLT